MADQEIKTIVQRARHIHKELKVPSRELQNTLEYIREKVAFKSALLPCGGCTSNKEQIGVSFRRAFGNFTERQRAEFYLKYVSIVREVMNNADEPIDSASIEPVKSSIYFFHEKERGWQKRQIELNPVTKVMTFKSSKEQIDLHNYVIRASKKKDRKGLALESIEGFQMPQIMRISNNNTPFEEFEKLFSEIGDEAFRQNVRRALRTNERTILRNETPHLSNKQIKRLADFPQFNSNKSLPQIPLGALYSEAKGKEKNQLLKSHKKDYQTKCISDYERLKRKLINSLINNAGLQQIRRNVFLDLKENRIRKLYEFKRQDDELPLQWFEDNLMICSTFRRWKKSLKSAKLLSHQGDDAIKLFCEKHEFQNNTQIGYTYKRERIVSSDNVLYFLDTPPEHNEYYEPTNGAVEYCIWKFERSSNMISIVIEGKVTHDGVRLGYPTLQLTDEFMGEMDYICSNVNMTLLNDTDLNINSVLFEEQYLEQIDRFEDVEELNEFYTIKDDNNGSIKPPGVGFLKPISQRFDKLKRVNIDEALKLPTAKNRLKFMHPNSPYEKMAAKYKLPQKKGQNPYWQGEWQFTNEGEMIIVNEQKLKTQSGVLKSIVKSLARYILSGKSILNMSLPVLVFSKDSNLSRLCKSNAYAPLLLERAVKQKDPVQRLKHIVAFGISRYVASIQMDKPFNPILGETFQMFIDGCPVFGEQISHHPPISSTFMKGRGYTLYGHFQAKVNMGINSVTALNDGYVHVSFDQTDYRKDVVKFNFPPAYISGITFGTRTLNVIQHSYYIDEGNMLFLQLNFSKHKGSTEYSRYFNGVEGKIVELLPGTDLSKPQKISKKSIKRQCGTICGRWTHEVFYEDQSIFDSWTDFPYVCEEYPCPLESDAFYRKDLRFKCDNDLQSAQTAKEELQEIQRNDRKLREMFTGKEY